MRPHISRVSFSGILGTPVISGNVFFFPANIFTLFDYICVFKPAFWNWSAGAFQMTALVDEYYYQPSGGGFHGPVDFQLLWIKPVDALGPILHNIPFGVSTTPNLFSMPPQTVDYWQA